MNSKLLSPAVDRGRTKARFEFDKCTLRDTALFTVTRMSSVCLTRITTEAAVMRRKRNCYNTFYTCALHFRADVIDFRVTERLNFGHGNEHDTEKTSRQFYPELRMVQNRL